MVPVSMPRRHSEVIKFLRDALAADAVGVPKLDAMGHAAGLLGERQRITQAKLFRRAKRSLGIRSRRDGFGEGGGWSWELPPSSDAPATISATTQAFSTRTRHPSRVGLGSCINSRKAGRAGCSAESNRFALDT